MTPGPCGKRGYAAIPVNPHADMLEGVAAYPSIQAIPEPVDGVIILLPKSAIASAIDDCLAAGVGRIWLQSPTGPGASPELVSRAREGGALVIDGGCPFMFLEKAHWFHTIHTTVARWTGEIQP